MWREGGILHLQGRCARRLSWEGCRGARQAPTSRGASVLCRGAEAETRLLSTPDGKDRRDTMEGIAGVLRSDPGGRCTAAWSGISLSTLSTAHPELGGAPAPAPAASTAPGESRPLTLNSWPSLESPASLVPIPRGQSRTVMFPHFSTAT